MTEVSEQAEPPLVISPRLTAVLRPDGIGIQRASLSGTQYLDLAGLHFLANLQARPAPTAMPAIASAASRAGVERPHLKDLNLNLRITKDLDPREAWTHPTVADHPDAATTPPFDIDSPERIIVPTPLSLRVDQGRYEIIDHEGRRWLALDPGEAWFLSKLARPTTAGNAIAAAGADPKGRIDAPRAAEILGLLDAAGLIRRIAPTEVDDEPETTSVKATPSAADRDTLMASRFREHFEAQNAAEAERRKATGEVRPRVVPVAFDIGVPAGVSMLVAYIKHHDGGRLDEAYEIRTDWLWNDEHLATFAAEPAIYLFSNYLWSHAQCLEVSRKVKELSPNSITIHGGPDTPKYERDVEAHFAAYPHVDITVRGEGEVTVTEILSTLEGRIGTSPVDLSVLHDVPGLSYRTAEGPVRTEDRDRIADLDTIPSPMLTGILDVFTGIPDTQITLETNRGCPYGCTFCDWGSATTSRVRKYDIDRVYAELEWCAEHRLQSVNVADANFGMFKRDVEIAEKVAEVRHATGFPKTFGVSYAKNTVKHLEQIIGTLADAEVMSQGVLSLQTMDTDTLQVIHRSNIKTERYDALANRMRRADLPLMVELMMGLPGQTVESFLDDLQQCIEREVPARINRTTLLINSPMNDPEYLGEHQIETNEPLIPGQTALVTSTSTFTEEEWREMNHLRLEFGHFENFGVLRLVARFVRQVTGMREVDLYRTLCELDDDAASRWPTLGATVTHGSAIMAPIYSWRLLMDEVGDYLAQAHGLTGSAVDSVLRAQHAVLPAPGRRFPHHVELEHDVVSWYHAMLAAKGTDTEAHWTEIVPRLEEFPPGTLTVDDPAEMNQLYIGMNREAFTVGMSWELDSPLSRAHITPEQLPEWTMERMFPQESAAVSVSISSGPRETAAG